MAKYNEDSVTGYKRDLDKIRARPSLYIGAMDNDGIFTLLRECMDNCVDEARAGRNNLVDIEIQSLRGPFIVRDNGAGIPVGKHKVLGISTFEHVLSNLQSSGKINQGAYTSAIGTHGVGLKGVTALSESFEAHTYRDNQWYKIEFAESKIVTNVTKSKAPNKQKAGTCFKFTPSKTFFKKSKLDISRLVAWAELTSFMNKGLEIRVTFENKTKVFKSKNGIKDYLTKRLNDLETEPAVPKEIFYTSNNIDMVLTWTDIESSALEFFTNTVRNLEEGVHANDMYKALADSLKPYGNAKDVWTVKDLQDGMVGLFNYKIDAPQFDSQTKEKLVDERVKGVCYTECLKAFSDFWEKNKGMAKSIVGRAALLRKKTADFLKSKKLIKNVKAAKNKLSGKLADVQGNIDREKTEVIIVEGDSAGGCFVNQTPVKTKDGIHMLGDLVETYNKDFIEISGYSFNSATQDFETSVLEQPRLTKHTTELVEVTLSDGSVYQCTPEHLWMLETGEYIAAENLSSGSILKSLV